MSWKSKLLILSFLALPCFVGYPVTAFEAEIIAGVRLGWVLYALLVHSAILVLAGAGFAEKAVTIAVLISAPVIFLGAGISFLLLPETAGAARGAASYSAHYVSLWITMLTVIPLTLSMMAVIPFHEFENALLGRPDGVSRAQKYALMFLRVFNHIVYGVIPGILEVIREERHYRNWLELRSQKHLTIVQRMRFRRQWVAALLRDMIHIGVEGICASIQYIPLWAVEISLLPGKSNSRSTACW
jgi:hypothetical protein